MKIKNKSTSIFYILTICILVGILSVSCTEPLPLYGKWLDNKGNTITFMNDKTFVASVTDPLDVKNTYEGSYVLLKNSISLTFSKNTKRIVSEWDINGNILYLNWTYEDGSIIPLSFYKISN